MSLPTDAQQVLLDKVRAMLADPTVDVEFSRGMQELEPDIDGNENFELTDGMTIVIKVHGGACVLPREKAQLAEIFREAGIHFEP